MSDVKIVSFDVGVINLAFCYMYKSSDSDRPFKIKDWQKINLMESDIKECKEDSCKTKAVWFYEKGDKNVYLCGKHKNIKNVLCPSKGKDIKTQSCNHIFKQKDKECNEDIKYTVKTGNKEYEYYCKKHAKVSGHYELKSIKSKGANKIDTVILQKRLLKILEKNSHLLDADVIVIENQPSLKNPKMKAIACTIFDYYLMRSTIDKKESEANVEKVVYMSPSNKLKLEKNNKLILEKTSKKKKYKMTKELAVKYCQQLLKHDSKNLKFIESQKKKDDLCDSFLQGCYYLTHKI